MQHTQHALLPPWPRGENNGRALKVTEPTPPQATSNSTTSVPGLVSSILSPPTPLCENNALSEQHGVFWGPWNLAVLCSGCP